MKVKLICLLFILFQGVFLGKQKSLAQTVAVSYQVFYDELSPYGTWVEYTDYGYVWVPNVAPGFAPYGSNGYWVFTDEGWTWVSYYSWGWAPFHYGRWFYDPLYGYIWVPGYEWGPGWVTWRRSDVYYGWAPIGPGISIDVAYSPAYNVPNNHWRFVKCGNLGRTNITNYYVNTTSNVTIIKNTTVINNVRVNNSRNVRYNAGPDRAEVEKRVGKPVTERVIRESNKPGNTAAADHVEMYRPWVDANNSAGTKPAPAKVVPLKEVKPASQRTETREQKANPPANTQPANKPRQERGTTNPQTTEPKQNNPPPQREPRNPQNTQPKQQDQSTQPSQPSQPQKTHEPRQPRNEQPNNPSKPQPSQPSQPSHPNPPPKNEGRRPR